MFHFRTCDHTEYCCCSNNLPQRWPFTVICCILPERESFTSFFLADCIRWSSGTIKSICCSKPPHCNYEYVGFPIIYALFASLLLNCLRRLLQPFNPRLWMPFIEAQAHTMGQLRGHYKTESWFQYDALHTDRFTLATASYANLSIIFVQCVKIVGCIWFEMLLGSHAMCGARGIHNDCCMTVCVEREDFCQAAFMNLATKKKNNSKQTFMLWAHGHGVYLQVTRNLEEIGIIEFGLWPCIINLWHRVCVGAVSSPISLLSYLGRRQKNSNQSCLIDDGNFNRLFCSAWNECKKKIKTAFFPHIPVMAMIWNKLFKNIDICVLLPPTQCRWVATICTNAKAEACGEASDCRETGHRQHRRLINCCMTCQTSILRSDHHQSMHLLLILPRFLCIAQNPIRWCFCCCFESLSTILISNKP